MLGPLWLREYEKKLGGLLEYGGHESITVAGTSIGVTMTTITGPKILVIYVETAAIRYRADGTAPTAAVGAPATPGDILVVDDVEEMANFRAIRRSSSSATLQVVFYKEKD